MELAPGIVVADRFRLVRPLGQGGMGAVWLAQHTGLDIPCAVKFIHEQAAQSPELRARFEREAKAAAQIRSPHVVQILDHGVWEGAPYIAMEFLEGEDLDHRLHHRGVLPPRETLALAVQVGRALAKAHGAGLVHRDLKPANIFLVRDEEREIAKVLDFGVAKVKETGLDGSTKTGAVLGTPFYMSPEQARGVKTIDHRSDLWALAVVVYQCLVGRLPFMGEALGDLFVKIIVEPLPVPSQAAGPDGVPPGFDAWWARAASRDPAQRFQTAKELSDTLGLALGVTIGEGVEVGSSLAIPVSLGSPASPARPAGLPSSQGGTIAMTPSQPVTPYAGGGSTPYPGGVTTPYSGGAPASGPPTPAGAMGPPTAPWLGGVPTPMQQAVIVPAAPLTAMPVPAQAGRGALVIALISGALLIGGVGAFFVFRARAPASDASPASATAPVLATTPPTATPPPPTIASVTQPETTAVTAAPSATATASASVSATAAALTSAPLKHGPATTKPAATAGPRPRTDFGF